MTLSTAPSEETTPNSTNSCLVFDVGANIGTKTREFLQKGCRIVCFEPQPACVEVLRKAFSGEQNITIVPAALGNQPGKEKLSICSAANTISTFSAAWKLGRFKEFVWDQEVEVGVITLDEAIRQYGLPDYCKLDVEGFEPEVLQGLTRQIPLISFEFTRETLDNVRECFQRLEHLGYGFFNLSFGETNAFRFSAWRPADALLDLLSSHPNPLFWGDIYASLHAQVPLVCKNVAPSMRSDQSNDVPHALRILREFEIAGLSYPGTPLRLHLGCGETHLDGYINIDYPQQRHNVMQVQADYETDLAELLLPEGSVDEIRLHHVFEHFERVTAIGMLIRWHSWLKVGGLLHIETPDILGSARTIAASDSQRIRMGVVRHLAGDQAADWAYHLDHWFPQRFERTLPALGFTDVRTRSWNWEHPPYLSNVEAIARKKEARPLAEQFQNADQLLWESTVSDVEKPTHETWRKQLRKFMGVECVGEFTPLRGTEMPPSSEEIRNIADATDRAESVAEILAERASILPIAEIHDFNQRFRDRWVASKARTVPANSSVLDVGAGTCLYRAHFAHCRYKAHDFKQYEGYKTACEGSYGTMDYVSDITAIPVADASFDVILCTEVFEHVPEPIAALREIARILKPGGRLFLTAPAMSGLHQLPYHFYSGYTPFWYRHFCEEFGMNAVEVTPNGGFFKFLAQECARVAWTMPKHEHLHGRHKEAIGTLFGELLPRFLFELDENCMIDQFTVAYHVEAIKKPVEIGEPGVSTVFLGSEIESVPSARQRDNMTTATETISDFSTSHYQRHNQRRLEHLATLNLDIAGKSVLELGAGIGDHTGFFLDRGCCVAATEGRPENLQALRERFHWIHVSLLDMDSPNSASLPQQNYQIVHCYGLLYHLKFPVEAIRFMAEHCSEMLLLETCVSFGSGRRLNLCSEASSNATQAISGTGCRPTRDWVFEELARHFEFVYLPVTQPWHEEFPLDWSNPNPSIPLSRAIFIASHHPMENPLLTTNIPMQQRRP